MTRVPFNRPFGTGREAELMMDAVQRGHISGDGHYTAVASAALSPMVGGGKVLLTTSCTHALEMSAMLLDLQPGDEVIMPSFTFVSTANAFALRGARPVFVDIARGTHNLDERLVEQAITPRTKAIVVVHYAGVGCEMDTLVSIANRHGLQLIEDNAHGLGGTYRSRPLGSFGGLSTLSFHETKNLQCGEGGALVLNDATLIERAEVLREKGTNRRRFLRGEVDKYTWVDIGSSYLPSDLLAAFLTAQLEAVDDIQRRRSFIWHTYATALAEWAAAEGFELPNPPDHIHHPSHIFWLLAPDLGCRQRFITSLDEADVSAVFHYIPLHNSPAGHRYWDGTPMPVTDDVSNRLVRLPLFPGMEHDELHRVVDAVLAFRS